MVSSQVNWVDYNYDTNFGLYSQADGDKIQFLGIKFDSIPNYMKVTVTPEENTTTPHICVSNTDSNCKDNRIAFGSHGIGNSSSVYIKKGQMEIEGTLYVLVTCEEEKCSYTVKFEGGEAAEIDINSVFSYVVSNENKNMIYQVMGNVEEGSYLTIGVEGSSFVEIEVDSELDIRYYSLDNGRIITYPINIAENSNILATFEIKGANIGDYLTLSIHTVTDEFVPDNLLYPNGPAIMGLLSGQDGYFKYECFPISALASDKYLNINKYYLTGKIYSKYGLVWLADHGWIIFSFIRKQ